MYAARRRGDSCKRTCKYSCTALCDRSTGDFGRRHVSGSNRRRAPKQDIIIKAAAVADYCPKYVSTEKVKKKDGELSLEMKCSQDILAYLGEHKKQGQFLCGFSMETENMLENSRKKLEKKNLDMIVANNLKVEGAGFAGDTNVVTMITENEEISLGKMSKEETAFEILNQILKMTK